jgi:xanthine dehydrogenase accessory factor
VNADRLAAPSTRCDRQRFIMTSYGLRTLLRMTKRLAEHSVVIVLGCNDVGSAVACALHGAGWSVVLVDDADPRWHRRGMAFTNAWYIGNAELDGAGACFCASLKSIPSVLGRGMIAATTWSWGSVADALHPAALVDAGRSRRRPEILRGRVPLTIGIGPDFVAGENVDVALEGPIDAADVAALAGRENDFPVSWRRSYVVASTRYGRFMTERRIGDNVRAGEKIGAVGNQTVSAPANGVLLGLAARGARIEPGDELVEVDPNGVPYRCHGISTGSRTVAAAVVSALGERTEAGGKTVPPSMPAGRARFADAAAPLTIAGRSAPSAGSVPESPASAQVVATLAPSAAHIESPAGGPVIAP